MDWSWIGRGLVGACAGEGREGGPAMDPDCSGAVACASARCVARGFEV